jgi:hypothetical protein
MLNLVPFPPMSSPHWPSIAYILKCNAIFILEIYSNALHSLQKKGN